MSKSVTQTRFTTSAKKQAAGTTAQTPLTVIIPAAGMGHRMKSYGPKCLLRVNNEETIIEKIISNVKKTFSFCEIIVVVGFEADKIIKKLSPEIRIIENQLYETTNTIESVRLAIHNSVYSNVLIIHGDLVFNINSIKDITEGGSCVVIDSRKRFKNDEVGVTIIDNHIANFAYGLESKWAQIAYLENQDLEMFKTLCFDRKRKKMFTFEVFNMMLDRGVKLKAVEPKSMTIKEIDSLKDL